MFVSNNVRYIILEDWKNIFEEYPEFLKELEGVPEKIYLDKNNILRFEKSDTSSSIYNESFRKDAIRRLGDKFRNDDIYRQSERQRGCSLHYYWEVFWWDWNNEYSNDYIYKGENNERV